MGNILRDLDDADAPSAGYHFNQRGGLVTGLLRPELELQGGRVIRLDQLYQMRTYGTVIEGWPTPSQNQAMVDHARKRAERVLHNMAPVLVLEPDDRPIPVPPSVVLKCGEYLQARPLLDIPHVACISLWDCDEGLSGTDPERSWMKSWLTVVHFQDQYALPFDPLAILRICSIDWDAVAENYEI